MTQTEAAAAFGASLRAASRWTGLEHAAGLRDLKLNRRGRRPGGAGRLSGKTDAARSGDDDRPDARPVETAVLSLDVLGGERGVLSFIVFQGRLRLIRMPGYCLELNPDELLNPDVKTNDPGKSRPTHRSKLMGSMRRHLYRRQKQPPL